jgi:O-methyltransferase
VRSSDSIANSQRAARRLDIVCAVASVRDLARSSAKRAQWWLRQNGRLERGLHTFTRLRGPTTRYSHELIVPLTSTYSPWYDDVDFRSTYDAIRTNTFVDQYKCYELWEQLGQVTHVDGDVLEVGVWRGGTGVLMARRCAQLGLPTTVYLADTFAGVAKAGSEDPWYRGGEHADTSPAVVEALAARVGVEVELLVGVFPEDTAHRIADRRFRFVHIDVDVYDSAKDVLDWVWDRLNVGGTVVWDDYGAFECEGVATLGRELFARQFSCGRLVHNANGHLLLVKLSDESIPELSRRD